MTGGDVTLNLTNAINGGASTFAADTPERSNFIQTDTTSLTAGAGPYWEFTVSAADHLLNLTDLSFAIGRVAANGNDDGPAIFNVTTSLDSHAAFLAPSDFEYTGDSDEMSAPANQVVDLTGTSFQSLDATTPIEFRIYVGNEFGFSISGGRIDTVILNGETVAVSETAIVPEPASLVLVGLGGLSLIRRRRR